MALSAAYRILLRGVGSVFWLLLFTVFSGCDDESKRRRVAEDALEAAAPAEFAAWHAAVELVEIASRAVGDAELQEAESGAQALRARIRMAEAEAETDLEAAAALLNDNVRSAVAIRNQRLQAAQMAAERFEEVWNARSGDLRFARPGHGIGTGNAARYAIENARAEADRTRRALEAAEAESARAKTEGEAEVRRLRVTTEAALQALIGGYTAEFEASLPPAVRALFAARDAEDVASARLARAAPEAWAALAALGELADRPK